LHAPGRITHAKESDGRVSFEVEPWPKSRSFILLNGLTREPRLTINGRRVDCSGPSQFLPKDRLAYFGVAGQSAGGDHPLAITRNLTAMNCQLTRFLNTLAAAILFASITRALPQSDVPWTAKQLKDPAALAAAITDPKAAKPVVFNIGPVRQIKGAVAIGPASKPDNLEKLRQQLAKLPKDKEIIIYCGCCPFSRCPNVRPAFELLQKLKFKNAKLLNLPSSLNDDWISKGYPLE
jgi:hypothetical protein